MADLFGKIKRALVGQKEPEPRPAPQGIRGGTATAPTMRREDGPPGQPRDFFPTAIGSSWEYTIQVAGDPLFYRQVVRQAGNGQVGVTVRGRFAPALHNRNQTFQLKVAVAQHAEAQGPLKYPSGVELSIAQDDLGVYDEHQRVFWAIATHQRFEVIQVVTYPPDYSSGGMGSWGSWGAGEGNSLRHLFFAERPGIRVGFGKDPEDMLAFEGLDSTKAAQWGGPVLHFVRQVKADAQSDEISRPFEEHMWYAGRKGLVELSQFVEGRETMHWVLKGFQSSGH